MSLLGRLFGPKRPPRIPVYYLSAIDVAGNAKATPIGSAPRLSDEDERALRKQHGRGDGVMRFGPKGGGYINDKVRGVEATLSWTGRQVDAVAFLSLELAHRAYPDLKLFEPEDAARLDPYLRHFPR